MNKQEALKAAIEIAKEAARGGNTGPALVIKYAYKEIIELQNDVDSSR